MSEFKEYSLGELIENTRLGGNYNTTNIPNDKPLIKMGNLSRGKIKLNKLEYIKDSKINKKDLLKFGDVLFNTRNTPELVGKIAIWKDELRKAYYNSNLMLFKFNNNLVEDNFYMNYLFNTKEFVKKTNSIAIGTTSVAAIYNRDLMKLKVKVAQKQEQKAIAKVLLNIDNLIDSLQKVIKKKENIRDGALLNMMNNNNWKEKQLDKILTYEQPTKYLVKSVEYLNAGIPVLTAGKTFILGYTDEKTGIYNKGNCIIFDDFTTAMKQVDFEFKVKSSAMKILTPVNDNYDLNFIFYAMKLIKYKAKDHKRHWISTYGKFSIKIPEDIKEQKNVSKKLLDMENEIEILKQKLEKYEKIKEGMMENLLTGKVRLCHE